MPKKLQNSIQSKAVLFYLLYWLFFLVVFTLYRYFLLTHAKTFSNIILLNYALLPNIVYLFTAALSIHLIIEKILPWYYSGEQYIGFSILIMVVSLASPLVGFLIAKFVVNEYITEKESVYTVSHYIATVMKYIFCLAPLVFLKTTEHLIKKESSRREVETAKLESDLKLREAELRLLRGQIQPHFLFNTLNNLYSLSIHHSEKTSEVIIKLSDLLNYIIYDCHSERVKIESEIDFLKSFIELEQIRHDESLKLSLSIEGNYDDKYIAPMLLHTFIENSFKHGANKTTGTAWIDIEINIGEDAMIFNVANSKSHDGNYPATGIGIINTKKRLNLIYPDKHKLEITETENVYSVFLEIKF